MTPPELLRVLRAELAASVDPKYREGQVRFFCETVKPYGVRAPALRKIEQAAWRDVRQWPPAQRNRFCEELWKSGKFEEGALAIYLCRRLRKQCGAAEFRRFEKWIDRYVDNWAHCDGVASWLLAAAIENEPSLIARLFAWTASKDRWKRRASIVALLQEAKRGRHTEAVFRIATALIEEKDDMVRKGVGWVLKEAYPKRPREVVEFLIERKDRAPRLVLRIAAEKMTARDRARVLKLGK
ncbi:MAG: DNA alkylation repair protein [Acidobacteriota bacterium]